MKKNLKPIFIIATIIIASILASSQLTSWFHWTFLPQNQMDEIIGETSGETSFNHVIEMGGYSKDRKKAEYETLFYETRYILDKLKEYKLPNIKLEEFEGSNTWDGIKGELWETKPTRQKLASYTDMRVMLVNGSTNTDTKGELVWIGTGSLEDIKDKKLEGKIVLTSSSPYLVHKNACLDRGAAGVVSFYSAAPLEEPRNIPWSRIRGSKNKKAKFAFAIHQRTGVRLRDRLKRGEKIKVHAQVKSTRYPTKLQVTTCLIPGSNPQAEEVVLCAHVFEGYTKQGGNDNKSGSAAILEAARTLNLLIKEGRLTQPRRGIRFLWAPEYSGTAAWVKKHSKDMKKMLCNINLDMVGLQLTKSLAFMTYTRTTYGNPHYINDVMENYLRYVGETNRHYVVNGFRKSFSRPIVAPSGTLEPMYYYTSTHMGSSDHEVFNDWGVGVPGININTWPDRWFHTSEDTADKLDPTMMKRSVVICAAAAYTIANADDKAAARIGSEIVSNANNRIGHQLARGLEEITRSKPALLSQTLKKAYGYIHAAAVNEEATLNSLLELAENKKKLQKTINKFISSVKSIKKANTSVLLAHSDKSKISFSKEENAAKKIIPLPTGLIKKNSYRGYSKLIAEAMKNSKIKRYSWEFRKKTNEIQLLINGKNDVYTIKTMLDTQFKSSTSLKDILNHLRVLKNAGLISY